MPLYKLAQKWFPILVFNVCCSVSGNDVRLFGCVMPHPVTLPNGGISALIFGNRIAAIVWPNGSGRSNQKTAISFLCLILLKPGCRIIRVRGRTCPFCALESLDTPAKMLYNVTGWWPLKQCAAVKPRVLVIIEAPHMCLPRIRKLNWYGCRRMSVAEPLMIRSLLSASKTSTAKLQITNFNIKPFD